MIETEWCRAVAVEVEGGGGGVGAGGGGGVDRGEIDKLHFISLRKEAEVLGNRPKKHSKVLFT